MFDTMKVAGAIREARISKNMTQMNLADEMGVSCQAVSNWERGSSMPDIGKLEELCRILELSLDQLLGVKCQAENVQKVIDYTNGKAEEPPSLKTIGDVAPLMKPDMLSHLAEDVQGEDMNLGELCGLAPFVGAEVLDGLAVRAKKVELGELCGLAPFLTRETLGILAERVDEERLELSELPALMPFVDAKVLDSLAARAKKVDLGQLCGLAPFLTRKTLESLVMRVDEDRLELSELQNLMPCVGKEVVGALAEKIAKR